MNTLYQASIAAKYKTYNVGPNCWGEIAEAENIGKAQTLISEALRLNERAHAAQPLVHIVQCGKLVSPCVSIYHKPNWHANHFIVIG